MDLSEPIQRLRAEAVRPDENNPDVFYVTLSRAVAELLVVDAERADYQQKAASDAEALESLRAAWNAHMLVCRQPRDVPSLEELRAWMDAPSDTASGGDVSR